MHRSIESIVPFLCIALLAFATGCVSKGKYNDVVTERDALTQEVTGLAAEREELSEELASSRTENEAMRRTYGQLVGELEEEVAAGQITISRVIDGIKLGVSDKLLFPSGGTQLEERGIAVLARVAEQIKGQDSIVFVEGHTDNVRVGPKLRSRYPTNWELAADRATVVVRVLSDNGVEPSRLRAVSRGPFAPLVPNDTAENRAKNRRTEIILREVPREGMASNR